uniref:Uncharacterized protein n=1 Tax=Arundo donax TaxID=35708 RepID=A0A0A9EA32_ARUDO
MGAKGWRPEVTAGRRNGTGPSSASASASG